MSMTRISNGTLAAYSAPALPIAAFVAPLGIYGPPFFATEMGLGLATTGAVFMVARFWDLGTDPLMGVISDKFPSRWGRRRHWMVLSVPVLLIATALVMFPQYLVGDSLSATYLLASLFLLYLGYTMLSISHMAWGAELSADYHERSRIQGWREFAHLISMASILLILAVLEQSGYALSATLKMNSMGAYVLILLPIAILIAVTRVGEPPVQSNSPRALGFVRSLKILAGNPYFLRILLSDLLIHVPSGIRGSLYIFYVSAVIGMPEWSAIIILSYFLAGPLAVPLWMRLSRRMSKHGAAALAVFLHMAVTAAYMIPGKGDALLFAALFFSSGIVYAGVPFMIRSMVADIVDYDRLQTGQDRTALYYATVCQCQTKKGQKCQMKKGQFWGDVVGCSYWLDG